MHNNHDIAKYIIVEPYKIHCLMNNCDMLESSLVCNV